MRSAATFREKLKMFSSMDLLTRALQDSTLPDFDDVSSLHGAEARSSAPGDLMLRECGMLVIVLLGLVGLV